MSHLIGCFFCIFKHFRVVNLREIRKEDFREEYLIDRQKLRVKIDGKVLNFVINLITILSMNCGIISS